MKREETGTNKKNWKEKNTEKGKKLNNTKKKMDETERNKKKQ